MHKTFRLRIEVAFIFTAADAVSHHVTQPEPLMVVTGTRFIESLTPEQQVHTVFHVASKEQLKWQLFSGARF